MIRILFVNVVNCLSIGAWYIIVVGTLVECVFKVVYCSIGYFELKKVISFEKKIFDYAAFSKSLGYVEHR